MDAVSVLLSALGGSTLLWLLRSPSIVSDQVGDPAWRWLLFAFTVGSNVIALLLPGRTSVPLGVVTVAIFVLLLLRTGTDDCLGGKGAAACAWLAGGVLLGWSYFSDFFTSPGIYEGRGVTYLAAVAYWFVVGLLLGRLRVNLGFLAYTSGAILSFMLVPTAWSPNFWRSCTEGVLEKCSVAGALYTSFSTSENYVAIVASLAFIASLIGLRGRDRLVLTTSSGAAILATGSRTAFFAIGVVMLYVGLCALYYRTSTRRHLSIPPLIATSMSVAFVVGSLFLILDARRDTLSRRGSIWLAARDYMEGRWVTGVGVSKWSFLQEAGESPQHFFHSAYVLVLFSGGLVGLTILGVWAYCALCVRDDSGRALITRAPVLFFLIYSFTEVIWNPLAVDGLSWIVPTLLALSGTVSGDVAKVDAGMKSRLDCDAGADNDVIATPLPPFTEPRDQTPSVGRGTAS